MKTIYFVRHGESTANAGFPVYQGETSELTEEGREQARFIAQRAEKLTIEALISSTAVRAQQTASFISEVIKLPVEINELFTERKLPKELFGKSMDDPQAKAMHQAWMSSFFQKDVRVGSGENFSDLKLRAGKALAYLFDRREEHILVTTHGFFLHMVAALVMLGDALTVEEFDKIATTIWVDNTGLTKLEYQDRVWSRFDGRHHKGWLFRVWNDHAHLG